MDSDRDDELFEKSAKIEELLERLKQAGDSNNVADGLMDKFEAIKERFRKLQSNEKEIFVNEYEDKLHDAVATLNEVVDGKANEEFQDYLILSITFLILIAFLFG